LKALVTGANGFVGSHLVERLLREGLDVVCQVRRTSRLTWLENLPVELRTASLEDRASISRAVEGVDCIFHVAALIRGRTPEAYNRVNVQGTRNLLEGISRTGTDLKRLVYVSSLAAAGPCPTEQPLDETAQPNPLPGYGASKLAAEQVVLAEKERLPVTVVRPPAVYGPRDTSFLSIFVIAQRYGLAPIIGSPHKELTFVHVDDLVQCLWLAATTDAAVGQVYFAGSATHRYGEFIDALEAALGRRLRRPRVPGLLARLIGELGELKWTLTGKPQVISRRKIRDVLQTRWTCSWEKARRDLGYEPTVELGEGLRQTARWYADNGWLAPIDGRQK